MKNVWHTFHSREKPSAESRLPAQRQRPADVRIYSSHKQRDTNTLVCRPYSVRYVLCMHTVFSPFSEDVTSESRLPCGVCRHTDQCAAVRRPWYWYIAALAGQTRTADVRGSQAIAQLTYRILCSRSEHHRMATWSSDPEHSESDHSQTVCGGRGGRRGRSGRCHNWKLPLSPTPTTTRPGPRKLLYLRGPMSAHPKVGGHRMQLEAAEQPGLRRARSLVTVYRVSMQPPSQR